MHHTESMHERKALMYDLAGAFIALPGGLGTLDELFETLTWAQIGLHRKPVGLLDVGGYFDGLLAFLHHTVDTGFVKQANIELLVADADPDRLLDLLATTEPPRPDKWIDRSRSDGSKSGCSVCGGACGFPDERGWSGPALITSGTSAAGGPGAHRLARPSSIEVLACSLVFGLVVVRYLSTSCSPPSESQLCVAAPAGRRRQCTGGAARRS
ncbi:MAG: TIGR00730 family Rossman fold protein [Acidimicrobiales bacterium]